eukprot:scaffold21620_cov65-Phaeocystis_antarctica.AAC.3
MVATGTCDTTHTPRVSATRWNKRATEVWVCVTHASCQRRARLVEALALTRPEARLFAEQAHARGAAARAPNTAAIPTAHWPKQCAVRVHACGPARERYGRDAISLKRE